MKKNRVLILGGGFGGLYAALEFEKRRDPDFEVTLISQDNYFLFTPMLHEVAASDLDLTHIVNPIRKMLRHVHFFEGEIRSIDVSKCEVVVSHGFDQHTHALEYDHIIFALGSVTNFYNIPNLMETAVTMKSLGDAIELRNRLIEHLEEADTECAAKDREPLLTFVVAGGGFAGVETIGSINDFLKEALPYYSNLKPEMIRMVLVHPGEFVLPELGEELGGKVPAHNIVANTRGKELIPFRFNTLGLLASIGRRTGVARILGINFSGFVAWWLWRTIYLLKLPRAEKKLRVALDWTLDVFFSKDFVQYLHQRSPVVVNKPPASSDAHPIETDPNRLTAVH
jgi:NADH dehydrogenase